MKSIRKNILSLILALSLLFVCSANTYAADNVRKLPTGSTENSVSAEPRISETLLLDFNVGSTSTSKSTGSLGTYTSSYSKMTLSVKLTVSGACTAYFRIKNSNGSSLGTASYNITKSGTYKCSTNPTSVSSGSYTYELWFDTSGLNYQCYIYGTHT